jgi:hypothetical protein
MFHPIQSSGVAPARVNREAVAALLWACKLASEGPDPVWRFMQINQASAPVGAPQSAVRPGFSGMARPNSSLGVLSALAIAVVLGGCSSDNRSNLIDTGPGGGPIDPPKSEFELAHRCVVMLADGAYVRRETMVPIGGAFSIDGYTTADSSAANAERFRLQPAGLGRFVFYTGDRKFMAGNGLLVTADDTPSDGADWTIEQPAEDELVFTAAAGGSPLAVDPIGGMLIQGITAAELTFEDAEDCSVYPEMPVGIAETYTGPESGPLVGFADIHAHMAMGSDMSDGSGNRGPSAGGVMYGHAVNRFGVIEAIKDCTEMHGPDGANSAEIVLDLNPNEPNPDGRHDTVGWPTFIDWPAKDSLLHQQMYWKWVERSYRAGLRLMVLHGTNIEALCDVAKKSVGDKNADCTDMGVGMKQVAYAHDMQDYIDAQYGGPGKGWFRIVKNPVEAEAVIRAGKMAVVPGLEFSNIFECNVTFGPGGQEVVGCDRASIDRQIDEAWDAGVRGIYLYHDVDSALGGTGIFSEVLNLVNYYGTKGFWQTYTCDDEWGDPEVHKGYFYNAGAVMPGMQEFNSFNDPISQALVENANGMYPAYPPGRQCNARNITELGRYALEAVMKKGFVLDIDHAPIRIKQAMLDEGAKTVPAYPMISAHGGHGGITNAQALQILRQGGIIYPGMVNGRQYKGFLEKVEAIWSQMNDAEKAAYPLAVGYGADQNGLANQPGSRSGSNVTPVNYVTGITLFEGPGWSDDFAAAGIQPVKVAQLKIDGGRTWNVDEDGVANYGMIPDVVEQIRLESAGDTKYLDAFYRSADAYVRLWKQTLTASAQRAAPVDPVSPPPMVPHPLDPTTGPLPLP